jgi:hypothetical protein
VCLRRRSTNSPAIGDLFDLFDFNGNQQNAPVKILPTTGGQRTSTTVTNLSNIAR